MSADLIVSFLILVILLIGAVYFIKFWGKRLSKPTDRRKEVEKSLKVDKIESLYEKGKITPEEFQNIRKVIAKKLNSIEEKETSDGEKENSQASQKSDNNKGREKKEKGK